MNALSDYSSHNRNVDFAGRLIYDDNNVEINNFGKHKGSPADFPQNTKDAFARIRLRIDQAKNKKSC